MPNVDRFIRRMEQRIDQQGWAVLTHFPADDHAHASFAYTIGLTAQGGPEVIIAGLDPTLSEHLLNDLARRVVERAQRFTAGQRISDVLDGYDAVLVEGPAAGVLRPAAAYVRYGENVVRLLQVVWPDARGRFPWEPGCTLSLHAQPLIGQP
jgi:hypothetical protein